MAYLPPHALACSPPSVLDCWTSCRPDFAVTPELFGKQVQLLEDMHAAKSLKSDARCTLKHFKNLQIAGKVVRLAEQRAIDEVQSGRDGRK